MVSIASQLVLHVLRTVTPVAAAVLHQAYLAFALIGFSAQRWTSDHPPTLAVWMPEQINSHSPRFGYCDLTDEVGQLGGIQCQEGWEELHTGAKMCNTVLGYIFAAFGFAVLGCAIGNIIPPLKNNRNVQVLFSVILACGMLVIGYFAYRRADHVVAAFTACDGVKGGSLIGAGAEFGIGYYHRVADCAFAVLIALTILHNSVKRSALTLPLAAVMISTLQFSWVFSTESMDLGHFPADQPLPVATFGHLIRRNFGSFVFATCEEIAQEPLREWFQVAFVIFCLGYVVSWLCTVSLVSWVTTHRHSRIVTFFFALSLGWGVALFIMLIRAYHVKFDDGKGNQTTLQDMKFIDGWSHPLMGHKGWGLAAGGMCLLAVWTSFFGDATTKSKAA